MRIFNKFRGTKGFLSLWERVIRFRDMISEQAKERVRILAFWEKHGDEATKEAFDTSPRTLFRWASALKKQGGKLEALNPGDRAPKGRRRRNTPEVLAGRIVTLRTEHPRLGKEKVHGILKTEGYTGSVSTVGRILGDLKAQGRIPKHTTLSVSARTGRLIEHVYKPRKKLRRPKGHREPE